MELLHTFLTKYANITPPHQSAVRLFVRVVRDECGIDLNERSVEMSRGGVYVRCHPTMRSELIQAAPRILATLQRDHNVRLAFVR